MVLFALRYHSKQDIVISGHIYSGAPAIRVRHESIKHADCRDTTCIDKTLFNKHFHAVISLLFGKPKPLCRSLNSHTLRHNARTNRTSILSRAVAVPVLEPLPAQALQEEAVVVQLLLHNIRSR